MVKCSNCGEQVSKFFILWKKGTKEKRGKNVTKVRDPKLVCERCVQTFPSHEVIHQYGG